jgi:hypothetical protein
MLHDGISDRTRIDVDARSLADLARRTAQHRRDDFESILAAARECAFETISGVDNALDGQLLVADFNGDGYPDAAIFGTDHVTGQSAVAVMLGNGNGTFQAGKETLLGSLPLPVGACGQSSGDYNGDGRTDIAFVSNGNNSHSVVVLPGKNDGTFSAPFTTSLSNSVPWSCLASGDFNNDSKTNLIITGAFGADLIMLGKGNGTFQSPVAIGQFGQVVIPAQLNGDSNLDLVAVSTNAPPSVSVLLGDGTGHFPTKHTYPAPKGYSYRPALVHDLNGDGHQDIAVESSTGHSDAVTILLNDGSGAFTTSSMYIGDGAGSLVAAADLNGDSKVDLAITNISNGVDVMLGNGDGTFKANLASYGFGDLRYSDFNNDGKPDLISGSSQIYLGNGNGTFTPKNTGCTLNQVAIGDFNKDGKLDLAGTTSIGGVPVIGICLGNGDGTFTQSTTYFDQGVQHGLVLAGDFNNDRKLDLVASDQNGFSVLLGNGDGTFQNGIPTAVNQTFPTIVVGAFTSDGKLDVAALTSSGISVFLGNGNGTFGSAIVSTGPTFGQITVVDLNNDGKRDLLITNGSNLNVSLGKGNGTFQPAVPYALKGASNTRAVYGDFNLDGKLDVAVGILPGDISVLFGDGTGKFTEPPTLFRAGGRIGLPGDGIVSADFNGDKKADLAFTVDMGYIVTFLNQK